MTSWSYNYPIVYLGYFFASALCVSGYVCPFVLLSLGKTVDVLLLFSFRLDSQCVAGGGVGGGGVQNWVLTNQCSLFAHSGFRLWQKSFINQSEVAYHVKFSRLFRVCVGSTDSLHNERLSVLRKRNFPENGRELMISKISSFVRSNKPIKEGSVMSHYHGSKIPGSQLIRSLLK